MIWKHLAISVGVGIGFAIGVNTLSSVHTEIFVRFIYFIMGVWTVYVCDSINNILNKRRSK